MKTASAILTLCLAGAAPALAQPTPPTGALPDDPEEPPPVVEPMPRPEPPPPPPPTIVVSSPATTAASTATAPARPTAFAVALGLGYVVPSFSDVAMPNITSVRVRLPSGLTFEPQLVLARETQETDNGVDEPEEDLTDDVEFGLNVRYPLRGNGKVDLSLTGGAAVAIVTDNPEGPDNNTRLSRFSLGWGVALDYWINHHWNLSFTAGNPLLRTDSITVDNGAGNPESSQTITTFGAIFDPTLTVMLHLYL